MIVRTCKGCYGGCILIAEGGNKDYSGEYFCPWRGGEAFDNSGYPEDGDMIMMFSCRSCQANCSIMTSPSDNMLPPSTCIVDGKPINWRDFTDAD